MDIADWSKLILLFNKGFEAGEGLVPLMRYLFKVGVHFDEGLGMEFIEHLAPRLRAAHDAGVGEDAQVLGDGLAREMRTLGQLGNGVRLP